MDHVVSSRAWWVAVVTVLAIFSTTPSTARAAAAPLKVTFVARSCPGYEDITANRARNNIQESLHDLGANTAYQAGQAVDPAVEQTHQPNCAPLPGWKFTLGTSYRTLAVNGPWGSLAKVLNPFPTSIVTQKSVPLLDRNGEPTGASIEGATTVTLSPEEAASAARGSGLWAQGGTPADPVLDTEYPAEYGFGSLRCALDGLNGDNVETIGFPQGARHEFCYAYYVTPPPTSGTIVVRKQVEDPGVDPQPFTFQGNISYTADHTFTLTAATERPGSVTFYRAATGSTEAPWSIEELPLAGWKLTNLSCRSASGASAITADTNTGKASVRLAGGDTVTCTYVDALETKGGGAPPSTAELTIAKRTIGGTGSFDFTETAAGGEPEHRTIATTTPEVPVADGPLIVEPGSYQLAENLPEPTQLGHWNLDSVSCDGEDRGTEEPVDLRLQSGSAVACLFTDSFVPSGQITLHKDTLGGVGSAGFLIRPLVESPETWSQTATTTEPGRPTLATGDDTDHMPLGRYQIIETNPSAVAGGWWNLDSVFCDGLPTGGAQGTIEVALTAAQPTLDCTFVNQLHPGAQPTDPSNPGGPPPSQGGGGVEGLKRASGPRAELSISKRVKPPVARPGEPVTYRIVVTNHGPGIAYNLVGTEVRSPQRQPIRVRSSRGSCTTAFPARCHLGRLLPHQHVIVTVHTIAGRPARLTNVVAVTSTTYDPDLKDNRAKATLLIKRQKTPPRFTG